MPIHFLKDRGTEGDAVTRSRFLDCIDSPSDLEFDEEAASADASKAHDGGLYIGTHACDWISVEDAAVELWAHADPPAGDMLDWSLYTQGNRVALCINFCPSCGLNLESLIEDKNTDDAFVDALARRVRNIEHD